MDFSHHPSLEDSAELATSEEDFFQEIEPLPEAEDSAAAIILRGIMENMIPRAVPGIDGGTPLRRMEAAFRQFVAAGMLVCPATVNPDGLPAHAIASALGISRAGLSKLMTAWSRKLGVLGAGMKSIEARESYRLRAKAQVHRRGATKAKPKHIGELNRDAETEQRDARTIDNALAKLTLDERAAIKRRQEQRANGEQIEDAVSVAWTPTERRSLREAGLIEAESDRLTEAGRARLEGLPPHCRGPLTDDLQFGCFPSSSFSMRNHFFNWGHGPRST